MERGKRDYALETLNCVLKKLATVQEMLDNKSSLCGDCSFPKYAEWDEHRIYDWLETAYSKTMKSIELLAYLKEVKK